MSKTAVFYGPEKGSVSKVAAMITEIVGLDKVTLIPVKHAGSSHLSEYENLVFGISTIGKATWDAEHKDNDWDVFQPKFKDVNWEGKRVAIYGLGDQIKYPDNFVDAIGWLYDRLAEYDVEVLGKCVTDDYSFFESAALRNGVFVGLPLDEDTEPEKTKPRLESWLECLKIEHHFFEL